jgi:hypothetical protein
MVRKEAEGLVVTLEGAGRNYWIPTGKWNPESLGWYEHEQSSKTTDFLLP